MANNRVDRGISHLDRQVWGLDANFPPKPDLKLWDVPVWWHHHGIKMRAFEEGEEDYNPDRVVIKGSAAEVSIARHPSWTDQWAVEWKVVQAAGEEFSHGRVLMESEDLERAFGLSDEPGAFGIAILKNHGGTTARQGTYIRYERFLNIPGPGTGHDGDPNVSIQLDEKIQNAIQKLVNPLFI